MKISLNTKFLEWAGWVSFMFELDNKIKQLLKYSVYLRENCDIQVQVKVYVSVKLSLGKSLLKLMRAQYSEFTWMFVSL